MQMLDCKQLVEQLGVDDWQTRETALTALFAQGGAALDALTAGLAHPNPQVRVWSADLMDHLADDRCVNPLTRALHDPVAQVRRHAVHSLGCQGCKAAPLQADIVGLLVERALTDSSIRVRRVAVHQLGLQPRDTRAIEALQQILQRDSDLKLLSRARFALQQQEAGDAARLQK